MFVSCDVDSNLNFDVEAGEVKKPLVVRVNDFDEASVAKFAKQMSAADDTGQHIIPIIIDSYGGDPYALLAMGDIIKSSRAKVATVVQGKAMSCGALLLSYGTEGYRFVSSQGTVMIHDTWQQDPALKKAEEAKADAAETDRLNKLLFHTMAKNVGKPADYFLKIVMEKHRVDWYLTPEETLKHNLANHVGIPRLVKTVTVTYDLEIEKPVQKKRAR